MFSSEEMQDSACDITWADTDFYRIVSRWLSLTLDLALRSVKRGDGQSLDFRFKPYLSTFLSSITMIDFRFALWTSLFMHLIALKYMWSLYKRVT